MLGSHQHGDWERIDEVHAQYSNVASPQHSNAGNAGNAGYGG
jgi:HPt (histidine-containing phosphotransfer) domain-containing protein